MIFPLFKKEIKSNYKIFLIFVAIISLYSSVIVAMYDPTLGESLNMMAESMPELFAAFGMTNPGATLIEFVTNYLFGFILIVIPFVFTLIIVSRLISRYIDKGSMAYLLATPHTRTQMIVTQLAVLVFGILLLVVYETLLVILCSYVMFEEKMPLDQYLTLNLGLFGMHILFAGMCYLSACCFNETKWSIGVGGGLGMVFILIQMLSQVSDKVEFLKYFTPLTLFDTMGLIAFESQALLMMGSLFVVGFVLFVVGIILFKKRDLPL